MGTVILITSEAGIRILFKVDSNQSAVARNVNTLLKREGSTSSTIMAGLLAVSPTHPVASQKDVGLPRVEVDFRLRQVGIALDGETHYTKFKEIV